MRKILESNSSSQFLERNFDRRSFINASNFKLEMCERSDEIQPRKTVCLKLGKIRITFISSFMPPFALAKKSSQASSKSKSSAGVGTPAVRLGA